MTSITLIVTGAAIRATVKGTLTSGMVGIPVTIRYDRSWDGLTKNLVCRSGLPYGPVNGETRTIANIETTATVAHEVMQAGRCLYLGIEGYRADGTLVIPTQWAECGTIHHSANADADPSADPTLPIWAQLETDISELRHSAVTQEQVGALVDAYWEEKTAESPAPETGGLSADASSLLITVLRSGMYCVDQSGNISALASELGVAESGDEGSSGTTEKSLTGITAVYSGGTVAVGTPVAELTNIEVTAKYDDGSTEMVTGYTLSGNIAEGSNTITVSYGGFSAAFTVMGVAADTGIYTITNRLTNVTSDNTAAAIEANTAYSARLTAADGYTLNTVTVTMGGVDVTSTVYADGAVTIAAVTGNVVITAAASAPLTLLHSWDLTQSLTDTVGGVTAVLTDAGAVRDAGGVTLDHSTEPGGYIYMADVAALNRTIEVDVESLTAGIGTHSRFLMLTNRSHGQLNGSTVTSAVANGLIFKSNTEWEIYSMDSEWTAVDGYTDIGLFDGRTARMKLYEKDGLYCMDAYCDHELMVSVSTAASPATMPHLIISANKNGISGVITAVRIYEGV